MLLHPALPDLFGGRLLSAPVAFLIELSWSEDVAAGHSPIH